MAFTPASSSVRYRREARASQYKPLSLAWSSMVVGPRSTSSSLPPQAASASSATDVASAAQALRVHDAPREARK